MASQTSEHVPVEESTAAYQSTLPAVSVVLLVWNGQKFLDQCITSLLAQAYEPFEIIVVDNASSDDSIQIAQKYVPKIRLIQNDYNFGFAGGNNVGLKAANGEVIVLLNQDTVVQPGWLQVLVDTFQEDPTIGIVGCKLLYPDGKTVQHAGAWVRDGDAFAYHTGQGEIDEGQYETQQDVDYVTGAAFAIHRRVIEQLGGLDEYFYPAFYEEIDYCYQARRLGFRVIYQPQAVVHHYETTTLPDQSYQRVSAYQRNRVRFVLRHWDATQLMQFIDTERTATADALWIDDAIARGRAYWINLTQLPMLVQQRQTCASLGPALSEGRMRWLAEMLQSLRRQAYARAVALLQTDEPPRVMPEAETRPSAASGPVPPDLAPEAWITVDNATFAHLQFLLNQIDRLDELEEHTFRSRVPILGGLITRFRSAWLSVATRWYLRPVLGQQSLVNHHVLESLGTIHQLLGTLAQGQEQQAHLRRQQFSHSQAQFNQIQQQIEQIQQQIDGIHHEFKIAARIRRILEEDDAALVEVLRVMIEGDRNLEQGE